MKRLRLAFVLALVASLLGGGLFYVALRQAYPAWDQLNLTNTALSVVVALLSGIAAWLLAWGVSSFKRTFQRAYTYLYIGIIIFGFAQAQYPIASYLNLGDWYLDGFISIPYLVAALCIFGGIRSFARLLNIHTHWASWWVVSLTAVAGMAVVAVLPHGPSDFPWIPLAAGNALAMLDCVFMTFAVVTILYVRHIIAKLYDDALLWLAIAFGVNVFAGLHFIVINLLFARYSNWYFQDSMAVLPFFLGAILLVRAGYAMVLVNDAVTAQATATSGRVPAPGAALPIIDIIVYTAGLASKPREIDQPLNVLRSITAQLQPGQQPTGDGQRRLIGV
ncbi:MAG TPA: hypothetical protein VLF67_03085, partial [Candidatus Saccharimonas sp.]|nr:hypothetical protein [Candidatus Saccharimonas sp.]